MAKDPKNTFAAAVEARLAAPKPKQEKVYFAERVRQQGAKDTGVRGEPIFPEGKPKYKVARPTVPAPTKLERELGAGVLKSRGDYMDAYLTNIEGGAEKFVAEQRANYERDDPDGLKKGGYALYPKPKDPLIDFDKRKKPILVSESDDTAIAPAAYYNSLTDTVAGVSLAQAKFDNAIDDRMEKDGHGIKASEVKNPYSTRSPLDAYNGTGVSIDDNDNRNTLLHELAHTYTSGADGEGQGQVHDQKEAGGIQDNLLKRGTYNTSTGAEYAQSVVTGLNSMRSITGQKLNDPQSVHQLFDEIEKNPAILNNVSREGGRLFRSYFYLKKNNPWAAEKLREATARDSKYLVENQAAEVLKSYRNA